MTMALLSLVLLPSLVPERLIPRGLPLPPAIQTFLLAVAGTVALVAVVLIAVEAFGDGGNGKPGG